MSEHTMVRRLRAIEAMRTDGEPSIAGDAANLIEKLIAERDAALARREAVDTIVERARELIGLHVSEQEGMRLPTGAQFQRAVDALAQAIGAADQHPRERDLAQDAGNNDHEDDAA